MLMNHESCANHLLLRATPSPMMLPMATAAAPPTTAIPMRPSTSNSQQYYCLFAVIIYKILVKFNEYYITTKMDVKPMMMN